MTAETSPARRFGPLLIAAPIVAALLIYSQTAAFTWDEGFHVLAAQLIAGGQRPWVDFVFPQTPLNAILAAVFMRMLGETWRLTHAIEALAASGAVFLVAQYVFDRTRSLSAAAVAALLAGLNVSVFEFATVGQAYGLCLLLSVAAFRLAVRPEPRSHFTVALAGLCAGGAAASSLLTAPFAVILFMWCLMRDGLRKLPAWLGGAILPFLPIIWLFVQSPQRAWFNMAGFQLHYRLIQWSDWFTHDLGIDTAWAANPGALLLMVLGVAGMIAARNHDTDPRLRRELYLSGALAAAETLYLLNIHPGFSRYYLLSVPFIAIPAGFGFVLLMRRMNNATRWWPAAAIALVLALGLTHNVPDDLDDYTWRGFEAIAQRVNQVTAPGAPIYADEPTYFMAHRLPPEGMSFAYSHKVELPPAEAARLGTVSKSELDRRVHDHKFATVETCDGDDEIKRLNLTKIYRQRADVGNCSIFWQ